MFRKLRACATAMRRTISDLLSQAEEIARGRGVEQPAAEHLVLAALQLPDGAAARALKRVGSSTAAFCAALEAQEAEDLERVGVHADSDRIRAGLPQRPDLSASTEASHLLGSCFKRLAKTPAATENRCSVRMSYVQPPRSSTVRLPEHSVACASTGRSYRLQPLPGSTTAEVKQPPCIPAASGHPLAGRFSGRRIGGWRGR